jgi:membrane-bound ClpP family serine protease
MKDARLIIAVITNLLDEGIIIAFIIFGLPRLGVHIPLYGTVLIGIAFLIYAVGFYILGSRIIKKKPIPGFTNMVGVEGRTVNRLAPQGQVKIQSEIWEAKSESGIINAGVNIVVVDQYGLKLVVRPKGLVHPPYSANPSKLTK